MLKKLIFILRLIVLTLAIYNLIVLTFFYDNTNTDMFKSMPFMIFFLGLFYLVTGFSELQLKRKRNAYMCFIVSVIIIFVSIYSYPVYN